MRIAIVGSGIIGLLTAVKCVSAGHDVVLVEQADIPFPGAASFDRHRVVRALHRSDPTATAAAVRAHHEWIFLQQVLSARFYEQVGALTVLPPEDLEVAQAMLDCVGSRARVLNADELALKYPQVEFPVGASALLEFQAGVLLADRILNACAAWLRGHPRAELRPNSKVVDIDADNATVRLADGGVLAASALVLAMGPWSRELLAADLASQLVLHRQSMLYCEVPAPDSAAWSGTPAIVSFGTNDGAWLVPPVVGTPLKLSAASACRVVAEIGDDSTPPYWRDHLVGAFAALIPGFHADRVIGTRDCYYLSLASTGGPLFTTLADRAVSYAACGGSSFKFAPLIARFIAERLTGADPAPTGLRSLDADIEPGQAPQPVSTEPAV